MANTTVRISPASEAFGRYQVWIIDAEALPHHTYGIVNLDTNVIEDMAPNLFNARNIAKQMDEWMASEVDSPDRGEERVAPFN